MTDMKVLGIFFFLGGGPLAACGDLEANLGVRVAMHYYVLECFSFIDTY